MDKVFLCTFLFGLLKYVQGTINVTQLRMPNSIELGSTNEIILDCFYEATEDETGVVVKWFFNGEHQIYQFIPEYNRHGATYEFWRQRLDSDFNVTDDTSTMYRALKIYNISQDLSGNYTCKVSSDNSEDEETEQLIVYSPAKSELDIIVFASDSLVICTVEGISPKPHMDFYIQAGDGSWTDIGETVELSPDDEGFYNVTAKHHYQNLTLPSLTTFVCNLTIPGTDYVLSKTWELGSDYTDVTQNEEDYVLNLNAVDNSTEVPEFSNYTKENSGAAQLYYSYISILLLLLVVCFNK